MGIENKGEKNGKCNRSACLSEDDVTWYNSGTYKYYCCKCAELINDACIADVGYDLCKQDNDTHTGQ